MHLRNSRPTSKGKRSRVGPGLSVLAPLAGPSSHWSCNIPVMTGRLQTLLWPQGAGSSLWYDDLRSAEEGNSQCLSLGWRKNQGTGHQNTAWQTSVKTESFMKPCFCRYVAMIDVVLIIEMNTVSVTWGLYILLEGTWWWQWCVFYSKKIHTKSTSQDLFYTSSFDILFTCLFFICINMAKIPILHFSLLPEYMGGMNDLRCNQKYQGNSFVSLINMLSAFYSYFKRIGWKNTE